MKLIIPNNIFATLFVLSIQERLKLELFVKESSLITKELKNDENAIALIPSFDLINNRELFVASNYGLGFDGLLSNSYIYFGVEGKNVSKILLRGDITTNDVILSKIIFKERYDISPDFSLDSSRFSHDKNYIICGSENWLDDKYRIGTSFSEQIVDSIEFPYINFVFASISENNLKKFQDNLGSVTEIVRINKDKYLKNIGLNENINSFITEELESLYFDFSEHENEALTELLQLAFYHKIFDDLFDVKYIK